MTGPELWITALAYIKQRNISDVNENRLGTKAGKLGRERGQT